MFATDNKKCIFIHFVVYIYTFYPERSETKNTSFLVHVLKHHV